VIKEAPPVPTKVIGKGINSFNVPVQLKTFDTGQTTSNSALIDSGATGSFIDRSYLETLKWNSRLMKHPVRVINVDGTNNEAGQITHAIDLLVTIDQHCERMTFGISNLGKTKIILGHDWLKRHNPEIDWQRRHVDFRQCPPHCRHV
jgi:hypothetical protein